MAGPQQPAPALDPDQAAVLRRLQAAFGAEQVTVTAVQPTSRPRPCHGPTAGWQAALSEEASCTSTCS